MIKIKLWGKKATIRFSNQYEEQFFANQMVSMRDSIPRPKISVRRNDRELPALKPKPMNKSIVVKPKPLENETKALRASGEHVFIDKEIPPMDAPNEKPLIVTIDPKKEE